MNATKMIAGEDLKSGQLVAVGEDGKVRFVLEPGTPGAKARPIFQAERLDVKNETQTPNIIGVGPVKGQDQKAMASVTLPNGNYAVAYTAEGKYQLATFSYTGALIHRETFGAASEDAEVAMTVTPESKIALAFKLGTTGWVQVVIVGQNGVAETAGVIEQTDTASSLSITCLETGRLVVAYATDVARHEVFAAIFDKTAKQLGNVITVDHFEDKTSAKQSVAVTALAEGGFVVAYAGIVKPTGRVFYKVFDNTGAAQPRRQAGEDIHLCEDAPFVGIVALKQGFAISSYGGIGPGYQINIYNAAGDGLGGNIVLDSFDQVQKPNRMAMTCLNNGNLAVIWATSRVHGAVFTPAGRTVHQRSYLGQAAGSVAVATAGAGAVVAFQSINVEDNTLQMFAGVVSEHMTGDVTMTSVEAANQHSAVVVGPLKSTLEYEGSTMFFAGGNVDEDLVQIDIMASYSIRAQSVIGVTMGEAKEGEEIAIQIEDEVVLSTPFKLPYRGDHREAGAIVGQKLAVIGNKAFLKGII